MAVDLLLALTELQDKVGAKHWLNMQDAKVGIDLLADVLDRLAEKVLGSVGNACNTHCAVSMSVVSLYTIGYTYLHVDLLEWTRNF
jgi:hypothetical protein